MSTYRFIIVLFFLLFVSFNELLMVSAKTKKVRVSYPIELLDPIIGPYFESNVTKDRLLCFGNKDYRDPSYYDAWVCLVQMYVVLPWGRYERNCDGIWGSRSIVIETKGSIEFLKINKLPMESLNEEVITMNVTKWLELPAVNARHWHREIKHAPAEPIYLCARSTNWDDGDLGYHHNNHNNLDYHNYPSQAWFSINFRSVHSREHDRRECQQKIFFHLLLVSATISTWALPYLIAIVVGVFSYIHGIKIFIICSVISGMVVCSAPIMLTKKNKHLAGHYLAYFLPGVKAEETLHVMRQRLPVFQAIFFSSAVVCIGSTCSYIIYSYFGIDREYRNTMIRLTLGFASSWFVFFLSRSLERFLRDWIWVVMAIALAQMLQPHMNPMCHDEVVGVTIVMSYSVKAVVTRCLHKVPLGNLVVNFFSLSGMSSRKPVRSDSCTSLLAEYDTSVGDNCLSSAHTTSGIIFESSDSTSKIKQLSHDDDIDDYPLTSSSLKSRIELNERFSQSRSPALPTIAAIQRSSSVDIAALYPLEQQQPKADEGPHKYQFVDNGNSTSDDKSEKRQSPRNIVERGSESSANSEELRICVEADLVLPSPSATTISYQGGLVTIPLLTAGPIYITNLGSISFSARINAESDSNNFVPLRLGPIWIPLASHQVFLAKTIQRGCQLVSNDCKSSVTASIVLPIDNRISLSTTVNCPDSKSCSDAKEGLLSSRFVQREIQAKLGTPRYHLSLVCFGAQLGIRLSLDGLAPPRATVLSQVNVLHDCLLVIERYVCGNLQNLSGNHFSCRAPPLVTFPVECAKGLEMIPPEILRNRLLNCSRWFDINISLQLPTADAAELISAHSLRMSNLARETINADSHAFEIAFALLAAIQVDIPSSWVTMVLSAARYSVYEQIAANTDTPQIGSEPTSCLIAQLVIPWIFEDCHVTNTRSFKEKSFVSTVDSSPSSNNCINSILSHSGEICCRLLSAEEAVAGGTAQSAHEPPLASQSQSPSRTGSVISGAKLSESFSLALLLGYMGSLVHSIAEEKVTKEKFSREVAEFGERETGASEGYPVLFGQEMSRFFASNDYFQENLEDDEAAVVQGELVNEEDSQDDEEFESNVIDEIKEATE